MIMGRKIKNARERDTYMMPRTDTRPVDWSGQPVYVPPAMIFVAGTGWVPVPPATD